MLSLDLINKLHLFSDVFNIDEYEVNKEKYIGRVVANKSKSIIYKDVYLTLKKNNYKFNFNCYKEALLYKFNIRYFKIKKTIKRYL
jgi:hypothetical protein